jgi:outer membrane immunogenic protein
MYGKAFVAALLGTSAALLAPGALAGEPDAGPVSWTGLYLGLQAGAGWADTDWTGPDVFFAVNTLSTQPDGWLFGGHVGYNFQRGPWVFGAEVSYSGSTLRETVVGVVPVFPADKFTTDIEDLFTATARIGYASSNWLVYARGGYANAEVALSGISGPPDAVTFSTSERLGGWTAGAGLEYKLAPKVVVGFEYNYVKLGAESFSTATGGTEVGLPINIDLGDVDIHSVKARLSIMLQ